MAYSEEKKEDVFNFILKQIEYNGKSLRSVLKMDGMPSSQTFYVWLENDASKSKQYARACEKRADALFEEILDIADESKMDKKTLDDGKEVVDNEVVQRSRLRIDARKWMLSKMNPKKYSDKIQVDNNDFKEQPLFPDE